MAARRAPARHDAKFGLGPDRWHMALGIGRARAEDLSREAHGGGSQHGQDLPPAIDKDKVFAKKIQSPSHCPAEALAPARADR